MPRAGLEPATPFGGWILSPFYIPITYCNLMLIQIKKCVCKKLCNF